MKDGRIIVIDINLTRGLVVLLALALLMAALVGYLAWGQREAAASGPQAPLAASASMRGYYLTINVYRGADADTACASGYHLASLWEILDPSNLKYNTTLGSSRADSGQGPPSYYISQGWVRTGYMNSTSTTAGEGNCDAWTSSSSSHRGTYAYLPTDWIAGHDIQVWEVGAASCSNYRGVWCVED